MDPNLSAYIDRMNARARLFNLPEIDKDCFSRGHPMFTEVKNALHEQLMCDLSPENLCCDGELRGVALRQKTDFLNSVSRALDQL